MKKIYYPLILTVVLCFATIKISFAKELTTKESAAAEMAEEGNKLLSKGMFSAAMAVWQKIIEKDANNANANFKMGMCYFNCCKTKYNG